MDHSMTTSRRFWGDRRARAGSLRHRRSNRFRLKPGLSELEERQLLSTFVVKSIADDNSQGTLRWAVASANTNPGADTISFDSSFSSAKTIKLLQGQLTLTDTTGATTITGPGSTKLTVSGNNLGRVFEVRTGVTAIISGLKVTEGLELNGGGILSRGNLTLNSVAITQNAVADTLAKGGGIAQFAGNLTITDSTITANEAEGGTGPKQGGFGGGLFADDSAIVNLTNCTISANIASSSGGGISNSVSDGQFHFGATINLSKSSISANTATIGGGIRNFFGTLNLTDTTVDGNNAIVPAAGVATASGAGVQNDYGTATLTRAVITGNKSAGDGGGLVNTSTMTAVDSKIQNNTAAKLGGGISNFLRLTLTNSTVSGNKATSGGGLYSIGVDHVNQGSFSNNSATSNGGGMYLGGEATLQGVTVSGNTSTRGAAIHTFGDSNTTISGSTISGNTAVNGGIFVASGVMTIERSTISGNKASKNGAGLYAGSWVTPGPAGRLYVGTINLTASTISGNAATENGGGVYVRTGSTGPFVATAALNMTNVTIAGNRAASGGGMFLRDTDLNEPLGTTFLTQVTVSGNQAPNGGGLVMIGPSTLTNTVVAKQLQGTDIVHNGPRDISANFCLIGDGSGGVVGIGNILGTVKVPIDPQLKPLGNYGGPTQTMALLPGSPLIDAAESPGDVPFDQRGVERPQGAFYDIGAVESRGFEITPDFGSTPQSTLPNEAFDNLLTVTVTSLDGDASAEGQFVTFTAPSSGPSATLSATSVKVVKGKASVKATANGLLGSYTVTASLGNSSATFVLSNVELKVSPLVLPDATAGSSYKETITAKGMNGGPYTFTVTTGQLPEGFTLTPAGVLSGKSNLAKSYNFSVTVQAGGGLSKVIPYRLNVNAAPASKLVILKQPSATAVAGATFASQPIVAVQDSFGNNIPGDGTWTITADSTGSAELQGTTTLVLTGGVATFSGLSYTKAEKFTIKFTTNAGRFTVTSDSIVVSPGATTKLAITKFPATVTAGASKSFTVTATDDYGNVKTDFVGTVSFSSSDPQAVLPAAAALNKGTGNFKATLKTAGTQSLTVTDGKIVTSQTGITVNPATLKSFIVTGPSSAVTSGSPFAILVRAVDSYSNTIVDYTGTVRFSTTDKNAGISLPANYKFTTGDKGSKSFQVTLITQGSQGVTATDTSRSTVKGTATVTVNAPAAAASLLSNGGGDGSESDLGVIDGLLAANSTSTTKTSSKKMLISSVVPDPLKAGAGSFLA